MAKVPYTPASYHDNAFNCPFCGAYADQNWHAITSPRIVGIIEDIELCRCGHCYRFSIWNEGAMVLPDSGEVESPNEDLSEEIKQDYSEAVSILQKSPRGAAALLRLAVQKLCIQLGENGKDINTDIGNLVKSGLSPTIQPVSYTHLTLPTKRIV